MIPGTISIAPITLNSSTGGTVKRQSISLISTDAAEISGTVSYQWHRSLTSGFTPATGTRVGTSSLTHTSTGLKAGTTYYFKLEYTDSSGTVVSNELAVTTKVKILHIGFIGDSITYGTGSNVAPPNRMRFYLEQLYPDTEVNVSNRGVSNTTTTQWQEGAAGSTLFADAISAFQTLGSISLVSIMIGTNDSRVADAITPEQYRLNVQALINSLAKYGFNTVMLHYMPAKRPSASTGSHLGTDNPKLLDYQKEIDKLINNINVIRGDTFAYEYFFYNVDELDDNVHPNNLGSEHLAMLQFQAIRKYLQDPKPFPSLQQISNAVVNAEPINKMLKRQGLITGVTASEKNAAQGIPGFLTTSDGSVNQVLTLNADGSVTISN